MLAISFLSALWPSSTARYSPPHPCRAVGAESPGAVRKLMALSDKVKPHNPKVPVGKVAVVSPVPNRKSGGPTSPRMGPSRPVPVNLTPESTCLGGGALQRKQPSRTGKELCPLKSWGISYVSPSRCVLTLGLHYVFFSNQLQLLIAHSIFKQQLFAENGK